MYEHGVWREVVELDLEPRIQPKTLLYKPYTLRGSLIIHIRLVVGEFYILGTFTVISGLVTVRTHGIFI